MRHYMVDPDNEERLLKIPPHVVAVIKAEALDAARQVVETYAEERLIKTKHPNKSEDITAALRVAADRIMNMQKDMGQPPSLPPSAGVPERYLT